MWEGKSVIFKVPCSKHLLSTNPARWEERNGHCISEQSSERQLTGLPQTQSFWVSNMAHPGWGWTRTQSIAFFRQVRPWCDQILFAMDINTVRNTCFDQCETQTPVWHLSPTFSFGCCCPSRNLSQPSYAVCICSSNALIAKDECHNSPRRCPKSDD